MVSSMEKKIDETEKKNEETNKLREERLKQALDAESKITELKTTMQRFLHWFLFMSKVVKYLNCILSQRGSRIKGFFLDNLGLIIWI